VWATFHRGTRIDDVSEFRYFDISEDKRSRLFPESPKVTKPRKNLSRSLEGGHVSRNHPYRGFRDQRLERETLQLREWQSSERIAAVHRRRTGGRVLGISRTHRFTG
jgi:hypothetical protein